MARPSVCLNGLLAVHAARNLRGGFEAGGGNVLAAVGTLSIGVCVNAGKGGGDGIEVLCLAVFQGKFQRALRSDLGTGVFCVREMLGSGLYPARGLAALLGQLGLNARLLLQQLLAVRSGLCFVHVVDSCK